MADGEWYYMDRTAAVGPQSLDEILSLRESGLLSDSSLIRQTGDWRALSAVLTALDEPPPLPFPAHSASMADRRWADAKPHPWRRYFARQIDTLINGVAASVLIIFTLIIISPDLGVIVSEKLGDKRISALLAPIAVVTACFGNALMIGLSGSSPGKWLFGVRVMGADGRPLGFPKALKREFLVIWRGLGLGVPLLCLATLANAFASAIEQANGLSHLKSDRITSWDRDLRVVIRQRSDSTPQRIMNAIGVLLLVASVAALKLIG